MCPYHLLNLDLFFRRLTRLGMLPPFHNQVIRTVTALPHPIHSLLHRSQHRLGLVLHVPLAVLQDTTGDSLFILAIIGDLILRDHTAVRGVVAAMVVGDGLEPLAGNPSRVFGGRGGALHYEAVQKNLREVPLLLRRGRAGHINLVCLDHDAAAQRVGPRLRSDVLRPARRGGPGRRRCLGSRRAFPRG